MSHLSWFGKVSFLCSVGLFLICASLLAKALLAGNVPGVLVFTMSLAVILFGMSVLYSNRDADIAHEQRLMRIMREVGVWDGITRSDTSSLDDRNLQMYLRYREVARMLGEDEAIHAFIAKRMKPEDAPFWVAYLEFVGCSVEGPPPTHPGYYALWNATRPRRCAM